MSTKYTKGPWSAVTYNVVTDSGPTYLVSNKDFPVSAHELRANARLIASAPELLEALEHCIAYFEKYKPKFCGVEDDRDCSPYNDAVEAIAKATGGDS